MTELSPTAKIILVASAKANCLQEWDHVNDPPCHPDDPDWNGCYTCIHRAGIAAALRAAAKQAENVHPVRPSTEWGEGWVEGVQDVVAGFRRIAAELEGAQ